MKYPGPELPYTKRQRTEYRDLELTNSSLGDRNYEMGPVKSMRTYIHTGDPTDVEEDGIHLHYHVDQESAISEGGREGRA